MTSSIDSLACAGRLGRAGILVGLLVVCAQADRINLIDGKTISDCTVVRENLGGVTYRLEGKSGEQTVKNETILSIDFERRPRAIEEAESRLAEGAMDEAIALYQGYLDEVLGGAKKEKVQWAPAYAMSRVLDMVANSGDAEGTIAAADRLIQNAAESRWVPGAYLAKAEALSAIGKKQEAGQTLAALRALIDQKSLGLRWDLECDLAAVSTDESLSGAAKRARLQEIITKAGDAFPLVKNHARVAEGESYLEGDKKEFDNARKVFQTIIDEAKADPSTLAGAYTGLGDCAFTQAVARINAKADGKAQLEDALLAYMRVVTSFKDQPRYRSKAMLFGARVLEFLGDDTSRLQARRLYAALLEEYGQTEWAAQARAKLGG